MVNIENPIVDHFRAKMPDNHILGAPKDILDLNFHRLGWLIYSKIPVDGRDFLFTKKEQAMDLFL